MEKIIVFGLIGILLVLIVGFSAMVETLRQLVTAVMLISSRPENMSPETEELLHSVAGLALLHGTGALSDEEFEKRKRELIEKNRDQRT